MSESKSVSSVRHSVSSPIRIGRRYIKREIRRILSDRPHISVELLCNELRLPYKKYRQLVWNERSRLNKSVRSRATPSTPSVVYHSLVFVGTLPRPLTYRGLDLAAANADKIKGKEETQPFGIWYLTENRNGEAAFVNDYVVAWLWPTGRIRIQVKKDSVGFEEAKVWAGVCLKALNLTDQEASSVDFITERHREFYIGRLLPKFSITDYAGNGIKEIGVDGSHPYSIEVKESFADMILDLKESYRGQAAELSQLREELSQMRTGFAEVESSNQKVTRELVDVVKAIAQPHTQVDTQVTPVTQPEQPKGEPWYQG